MEEYEWTQTVLIFFLPAKHLCTKNPWGLQLKLLITSKSGVISFNDPIDPDTYLNKRAIEKLLKDQFLFYLCISWISLASKCIHDMTSS